MTLKSEAEWDQGIVSTKPSTQVSQHSALLYTWLVSDRIQPYLLKELCWLRFTLGQRQGVNRLQIKQDRFYEGAALPCQIPSWLMWEKLAGLKKCWLFSSCGVYFELSYNLWQCWIIRHVYNLVILLHRSTGHLQWITLGLPCAVKYASGKWVMYVGMSMYGCLSMCAGALQWVGCQWREGQRMAQGLSPFLWFNMTPLALRLRQLRMHMPAILFVVGDYSVIKVPVSRSMAGLQNYCSPPPRLRKLSPGL